MTRRKPCGWPAGTPEAGLLCPSVWTTPTPAGGLTPLKLRRSAQPLTWCAGLRLAYMALNSIIDDTPVKPIDGYTAAQRYFLTYGQIWCQNVTNQEARKRVLTDSHSQMGR